MSTGASASKPILPECLDVLRVQGPPPSMYYLANFVTEEEEQSLLKAINSAPLPQWRQLSNRRLQSLPCPLSAQNVLLDGSLPKWLLPPIKRLKGIPIHSNHPSDAQDASESPNSCKHIFHDSPHQGPNHCLVNEYLPGQGIMPHEDGPAYYPITATVSLGSHTVLEVKSKSREAAGHHNLHSGSSHHEDANENSRQGHWRILCEARSLLITTGEAYVETLHSIEGIEEDRDVMPPLMASEDDGCKIGIANWDLLGDESWRHGQRRRRREKRISLTYRDVLKVKTIKGLNVLKNFNRNKDVRS